MFPGTATSEGLLCVDPPSLPLVGVLGRHRVADSSLHLSLAKSSETVLIVSSSTGRKLDRKCRLEGPPESSLLLKEAT